MKRIIGGLVLALIGAGMLWGTAAMVQSTLKWKAEGVRVEGTVVDFESHVDRDSNGKRRTMYTPVIAYTTADGQAFTFMPDSSSSSPGYDRGEKVPVLYSPSTPERAHLDSFMENWLGPTILGVLGLLFGPGGIGLVTSGIRQKRVQSWLKANGRKVQAQFIGAELDDTFKINGRSPWRLRANWKHPVTGNLHTMYSDHIWFDPTPYCKRDMIEALVNPDRPEQYRLDVGFLPKKA